LKLVRLLAAVAKMSTKERAAVDRNPLSDAGILKLVLSFVGRGHWLYIAEVSALWHETYTMVPVMPLPALPNMFFQKPRFFRCHPRMTLGQAVFASPPRLRWAHEAELELDIIKMRYTAGWFADQETLAVARELENGLLELDFVLFALLYLVAATR
jgi:hypothetical protein